MYGFEDGCEIVAHVPSGVSKKTVDDWIDGLIKGCTFMIDNFDAIWDETPIEGFDPKTSWIQKDDDGIAYVIPRNAAFPALYEKQNKRWVKGKVVDKDTTLRNLKLHLTWIQKRDSELRALVLAGIDERSRKRAETKAAKKV